MNTFFELRNYILKLYRENLKLINNSESKEEDIDEGFMSDNDIEIASAIVDNIINLPDEIFNNVVSLLILYFMSRELSVVDYFGEKDNDDELINLIINENKDYVISTFKDTDSGFLFDLVNLILEEDIKMYSSDIIESDMLEDYNYYNYIEEALRNSKDTISLFKEYHPDLNAEAIDYQEYQKNEFYAFKYSEKTIKSLGEFLQLFIIVKSKLNNNVYCQFFLQQLLENTRNNNNELYHNIVIFILKYYYIYNYLDNKNDCDCIKFEVLDIIQNMRNDDSCLLDDNIIKKFSQFDFTNYMNDFNRLPKEVVTEVNDLISLDNIKMYGTNGRWCEYREEDFDKVFRYCPVWCPIDISDNQKVEIYYSEDKDSKFTIPRICVLYSKDGKILDVMGRDADVAVEFEMLDILTDKIKNSSNYDEVEVGLANLKKLSSINDKIENDEKLTTDEIGFLYEIDSNVEKSIFNHVDRRYVDVMDSANIRQNLATYFNCSTSEVALIEEELNENTVVSAYFFPKVEICNYPKLKVIFDSAYGNYLKSAKGLSSLEYIKGDAYFDSLGDLTGLENLKRVDGNLMFGAVRDISKLNPNLVVLGNTSYDNLEINKSKKMNKKNYDN